MSNEVIIHIAYKAGALPFCKNRNGLYSATPVEAKEWGYDRTCKRCAAKAAKIEAIREKREAGH